MSTQRIYGYISITLCILIVWVYAGYHARPDGNLHVVFCSVGQGDAIYMRLPDGKDLIIDGGPNTDILNCISKHMPFWDRTIDLVVLTHPQYDHYRGLTEVIKRYRVNLVFLPPVNNEAESYQDFLATVQKYNIPIRNVYEGDAFHLAGEISASEVTMRILSPDYDWVEDNIRISNQDYKLITHKVFAATTTYSDLNDFSIVAEVAYGKFNVLLTGDAEHQILERIIRQKKLDTTTIEVFKVGHHGAAAGLSEFVAHALKPDLTVISVGAHNRYGHPADELLQILAAEELPLKRTDRDGDIHIMSNGEWWKIQ